MAAFLSAWNRSPFQKEVWLFQYGLLEILYIGNGCLGKHPFLSGWDWGSRCKLLSLDFTDPYPAGTHEGTISEPRVSISRVFDCQPTCQRPFESVLLLWRMSHSFTYPSAIHVTGTQLWFLRGNPQNTHKSFGGPAPKNQSFPMCLPFVLPRLIPRPAQPLSPKRNGKQHGHGWISGPDAGLGGTRRQGEWVAGRRTRWIDEV